MDLSNFNLENPKELFEFNKFKFLCENCDNVIIDGERYGNTINEKLERWALIFLPDKDGNRNFENLEFDYKIGGMEFSDSDFINHEIRTLESVYNKLFEKLNNQYLNDFNGTAPKLYLPKRKEVYLNFLNSQRETKNSKAEKTIQSFFINIENINQLLIDINEKFPFTKGKNLAGLIFLLQKEFKVLEIQDRQLSEFISCFSDYFKYEIKYEAVRKVKQDDMLEYFLKPIREKLKPIIERNQKVG